MTRLRTATAPQANDEGMRKTEDRKAAQMLLRFSDRAVLDGADNGLEIKARILRVAQC